MDKKWPWYRLDEGYGWEQNLLIWFYAVAGIAALLALAFWLF